MMKLVEKNENSSVVFVCWEKGFDGNATNYYKPFYRVLKTHLRYVMCT